MTQPPLLQRLLIWYRPQENSELANTLVNQTISYVKELNQQSMATTLNTFESQLNQAEADLEDALKPRKNM